jgi:hypothetical protein
MTTRVETAGSVLSDRRMYGVAFATSAATGIAGVKTELRRHGRVTDTSEVVALEFPGPASIANAYSVCCAWLPFSDTVQRSATVGQLMAELEDAGAKSIRITSMEIPAAVRTVAISAPTGTSASQMIATASARAADVSADMLQAPVDAAHTVINTVKWTAIGIGVLGAVLLGSAIYVAVTKTESVATIAASTAKVFA